MAFEASIRRQQVGRSWEATGSFSSSPKAHHTRSNSNVIYYMHGRTPTSILLHAQSSSTARCSAVLSCLSRNNPIMNARRGLDGRPQTQSGSPLLVRASGGPHALFDLNHESTSTKAIQSLVKEYVYWVLQNHIHINIIMTGHCYTAQKAALCPPCFALFLVLFPLASALSSHPFLGLLLPSISRALRQELLLMLLKRQGRHRRETNQNPKKDFSLASVIPQPDAHLHSEREKTGALRPQ